jgi:hypothetical protein
MSGSSHECETRALLVCAKKRTETYLGAGAASELDLRDLFFSVGALGWLFELRPGKRVQHSRLVCEETDRL